MLGFLFGTLILGIIIVGGSLFVMALIPAILNALWRAIFGGK
jgi:hypothetical protein